MFLQVWSRVEEVLRDNNSGSTAIRGWAALQLGQRLVDHGCLHDLVEGVFGLELGVGVALGVFVVDAGNLGEVLILSTVPVFRMLAWYPLF